MDNITQLLNRHPWAEHLFSRIFHVAVLLLVIFVCMKLIRVLCKQILASAKRHQGDATSHKREREKRITTIVMLLQTSMIVVLFAVAILMGLRDFGLDITPLLTGAGVAGVAIGLGAQSLVKDWIAGFFLLVEDQIRVGDFVKIAGLSGTVEKMELRITAIRDNDGTLHIVPNGEIKAVSNMTHDFAIAVVSIPLPYQVDLKLIYVILEEISRKFESEDKWKAFLRGHVNIEGITAFTTYGITIQLTIKTTSHARGNVAAELRHRIKLGLENHGVKLLSSMLLNDESRLTV